MMEGTVGACFLEHGVVKIVSLATGIHGWIPATFLVVNEVKQNLAPCRLVLAECVGSRHGAMNVPVSSSVDG